MLRLNKTGRDGNKATLFKFSDLIFSLPNKIRIEGGRA